MCSRLIFALPFAVGIAIVETAEYVHIWGARNADMASGDIFQREKISRWGVPGGRLTIQLVDKNATVIAITNIPSMRELPDRVQFRFTGDPAREVFIEGEEHPFWVALFLWGCSIGIVALCVVPMFRRDEHFSESQATAKQEADSFPSDPSASLDLGK